MKKYEFSIVASGLNPEAEDFEQRFYNAGCDDATISFQKGHIIVDFTREANSIDEALVSAVKGVETAGARVDRVEPDPLVSLADIAHRTGMTRAAMTQYSKGQRGKDFPPPVVRVTSDSPLWDWATVAKWLFRGNSGPCRDEHTDAASTAHPYHELRDDDIRDLISDAGRAFPVTHSLHRDVISVSPGVCDFWWIYARRCIRNCCRYRRHFFRSAVPGHGCRCCIRRDVLFREGVAWQIDR